MEITASTPGILHRYAPPKLVAFEHTPQNTEHCPNKLLFIGGLGDGLFSVPFVTRLTELEGWRLVEVLITSSYTGWGMGSVQRDAEELAKCVEYFRGLEKEGEKGNIILMGHSTGSQDTLQYLINSNAWPEARRLDGAILQAPASDRESIDWLTDKTTYLTSLEFAESWIKDGKGDEVVPKQFRPGYEHVGITAERWFSLAAPLDKDGIPKGSEDFFSADLKDETLAETFGKIPKDTPLLILMCGADQWALPTVDKEKLVGRWKDVCEKAGVKVAEDGGVVPNFTHEGKGVSEDVMQDLVGRVKNFLKFVQGT